MPPASSTTLFMPKKKRGQVRPTQPTPPGQTANGIKPGSTSTDAKGKGPEIAPAAVGSAKARAVPAGLRALGGASSRSSSQTSSVKPETPRAYRDIIIYSAGPDELEGSALNVMRFTSGDPSKFFSDKFTVMLNRKDPNAEPLAVATPRPTNSNDVTARYQLDAAGKPVLGPDGQPLPLPPKVLADTSLIAPHGGAQAAKARSQARAKSGRKAFQKQRQVKQRYNGGDPAYWQGVNQEKLPWVLDIQSAEERNAGQEGLRYLGRVERQDGTGYAAIVLHWTAGGGPGEYAEMFPVANDYRFDASRSLQTIDNEQATKMLENAMAFKGSGNRWALRSSSSRQADASIAIDIDEEDRKPRIKREGGVSTTGLAARLEEMMKQKDVKPKIKRERFDDEERGRSRTRAPGLERLEGEDLDFEERNEYQDDEEGFQLGIEEEQEAKELEAKNKVEFDRANRNVGVLAQNRGSDSDEDDLFGDKEDEETKKKVKKLLRKRMGEDDDSSSDEYADSDEESSSSDESGEEAAPAEGDSPVKPTSRASRSDTGRSPSPAPVRSPSVTSPEVNRRTGNGKQQSRRSETPDALRKGHGHQMLAQRAISPVRSRAGSPIGRSRSKDRDSNSRKRKADNRERNTAPADSSSRDSTPMSKKHRPNTDHGTSSALSPENASYLPTPTTFDVSEPVHKPAPGKAPKHKSRGSKNKAGTAKPGEELQDFPDAIPVKAFKDFLRTGPKKQSDFLVKFQQQLSRTSANNRRLQQLLRMYALQEGALYKLRD